MYKNVPCHRFRYINFAITSTHLTLIVQCISLVENTFSTYFTASISVNNKLTNVNYVTFAVEHDVAIVPVLDLKQEADNACRLPC